LRRFFSEDRGHPGLEIPIDPFPGRFDAAPLAAFSRFAQGCVPTHALLKTPGERHPEGRRHPALASGVLSDGKPVDSLIVKRILQPSRNYRFALVIHDLRRVEFKHPIVEEFVFRYREVISVFVDGNIGHVVDFTRISPACENFESHIDAVYRPGARMPNQGD
jgi:hypothetical protein